MSETCGSTKTGTGDPCNTKAKGGGLCYRHKEKEEKPNDFGIEKPKVSDSDHILLQHIIPDAESASSTTWQEGKGNWQSTSFTVIKEKPSLWSKVRNWFSRGRKQSSSNKTL